MLKQIIHLLLLVFLSVQLSNGQTIELDSCGTDINPVLNSYEIDYFKNVLFKEHVSTKEFNFKGKKLAFFRCTEGFLLKNKYFEHLKFSHKRPRGIHVLSLNNKNKLGGYDAIIIIDCKTINDKVLLEEFQQYLQSK
ncbi:hypothetical protein GXP67_17885 [Rhodocytophaga rosea]|uniref:DUF8192 domain-containing protein n=1 Tax=Rhodocytophaga rosea TaxID=2704465 RepID=A0A6C0GK22_9BACT|nr:hypothetical protein [Rhodocytophaga rosea]QHT68378.1 hypothetical protein GXP67_17885 [Rhodocytophaga rosea]